MILFADSAEDFSLWLALWEKNGEHEVFAHPHYVGLYTNKHVQACAAFYESAKGSILYPFLLRDLKGEKFWKPEAGISFDIATPYGYGGPLPVKNNESDELSNENRKELFKGFYSSFHSWAIENNVVSEFVRFSLFSDARHYYYGTVEHNNDNIVCDTSLSSEELWKGFKHKVRKNIRIALNNGLLVKEDLTGEHLDDFIEVYFDTLKRRKASPFYFFPKEYFVALLKQQPKHCVFFHVFYQGRIIASELVLLSNSCGYSFLGGTMQQHFNMRPGELLKYHIIKWAYKQGLTKFVIGGGHKQHDGIFAFKEAFAPGGVMPFFTGKMVFNKEKYQTLIGKQRYDMTGFFPAYRAEQGSKSTHG